MKNLPTLIFLLFFVVPAHSEDPSNFAVTDIVGLEELHREFGKFRDLLSEKVGRKVEFFPVTSRTVVVEALSAKQVDFVLTGPAEYVILNNRTKAQPVVSLTRPDYFSCIVALTKSGFKSVSDLKGKKIAFGDVGSTAYHLGPVQLLSDAGIDPRRDLQGVNISKHVGWEALKRGDVDALGLKHEQFEIFLSKEKELPESVFTVVARGEDLPNDVLVAGAHVDRATTKAFGEAFAGNSDELIAAILTGERNQKYNGMEFVVGVTDGDYDVVRRMYVTAGYPEFGEKQDSS